MMVFSVGVFVAGALALVFWVEVAQCIEILFCDGFVELRIEFDSLCLQDVT